MSNFDRNAYGRYGGVARADTAAIDQGLRAYMLGIYNHMVLGLAISALVALGTHMLVGPNIRSLTPFGQALYFSPLKYLVMLAPLGFVLVLSWRFERMSFATLAGTFYAFAAVMGVSLSTILLVYTSASIVQVFFITAASFGALSLYGYTTSRSLSAVGSFMMMGLFGLIIAGLVNMFLQSSALQFAISCIGVVVFAGLTAWDTQRLKNDYFQFAGDDVMVQKASIMGALTLYLDFINLFQLLLSLVGNRNND